MAGYISGLDCQVHILKVVGSNPTPAIIFNNLILCVVVVLFMKVLSFSNQFHCVVHIF